jgi:hypothetical protein
VFFRYAQQLGPVSWRRSSSRPRTAQPTNRATDQTEALADLCLSLAVDVTGLTSLLRAPVGEKIVMKKIEAMEESDQVQLLVEIADLRISHDVRPVSRKMNE